MEGWLMKIGFKSGKWQKRYCCLRGNLFTYASSPDSKKTPITIDKSVCVQTVEQGDLLDNALAFKSEQIMRDKFAFKLSCGWKSDSIRAYYFVAEDQTKLDEWLFALIAELQMMFDAPLRKKIARQQSLAPTMPLAATPFFLEIVGASRLPPSLPDSMGTYARVRAVDEDGKELFPWLHGPAIRSPNGSPIWCAYFRTTALFTSKSLLHLEVWERGRSREDSLVGKIDVSGLQLNGRKTLRLEPGPGDSSQRLVDAAVTLQRVVPLFCRKVLYLVRCAAPRDGDVKEMQGDASLGPEGFKAANLLNKLWCEPRSSTCRKEMMDVDAVITSPLCRALQTAIVAFHNLPNPKLLFQLSAICRELRRPSTHAISTVTGRALLDRALSGLREHMALPSSTRSVDLFDCHSPWWSPCADDERDEDERVTHARALLHCLKFRAGVLVSHQHFLQKLISTCATAEVSASPVAKELLAPDGFPRTELVRVVMDMDAPGGPAIVALERPWRSSAL